MTLFQETIEQLHTQHPHARFLVTSNDHTVVLDLAARLPQGLVISPHLLPGGVWGHLNLSPGHVLHHYRVLAGHYRDRQSMGGWLLQLVEWDLLSRTDMIMGSWGSVFAAEAARVRHIPRVAVLGVEHGGSRLVSGSGVVESCLLGAGKGAAVCEAFSMAYGLQLHCE